MNEILLAIVRHLRVQDQLVRVAELHAAIQAQAIDVDEALQRLRDARLIRATFQGDAVVLTPDGRAAAEDDCVLALTLGMPYIVEYFSPATVHIIVRGQNQDEASGSGFFSADYAGWIVTAGHVLRNGQILRIEDHNSAIISEGPFDIIVAGETDLGAIRCACPATTTPIHIEWSRDHVRRVQDLVILGYPPFPNHNPALHHARAELHSVPKRLGTNLDSLIISSVTRPGFSGGPVLNQRGRVIGIVEQENIGEGANQQPISYFSATPAEYSRMINIPDDHDE